MLRDFNFCVIDEVDSILIDEARTPLIISGPSDKSSDRWAVLSSASKIPLAFSLPLLRGLAIFVEQHPCACLHMPCIKASCHLCIARQPCWAPLHSGSSCDALLQVQIPEVC